MSVVFNRRTLLVTAAALVTSNHCLAASQRLIGSQAKAENTLLETYGGRIKYQRRFPAISRTGPTTAIYLNRMFPSEELKHLDSITTQLVVRDSNSWELIYEGTVYFEKLRGYVVRKEFTSVQRDITASLFLASIERNTKRVTL